MNTCPSLFTENHRNMALAHSKLLANCPLLHCACEAPDLTNSFWGQLCHSIPSAYRWIAPSLFNAISRVFQVCSKKQVVRSSAFVVVTFMEYVQPFRNGPVGENPGKPMCTTAFSVDHELGISIVESRSRPTPASILFNNLLPEVKLSICEALYRTVVIFLAGYCAEISLELLAAYVTFALHLKTFLLGATSPAASTARAQFISGTFTMRNQLSKGDILWQM